MDPVDSRAWLTALRAEGPEREEAARKLHAMLLRATRFQLARRAARPLLRGESVDDVATEAASDALLAVLAHLDEFRGESRFTTWAYKFAIFHASRVLRRRMWKTRELPLDSDDWTPPELSAAAPDEVLGDLEWLHVLRHAIDELLSDRQRIVFVAVALNGVPIDVMAVRLDTTRGAVYKILHDARRKLRAQLDLGLPELELRASR